MTAIYDRLVALASCLCAQIDTDGLPPTCFCGVIPGDAAVVQYAGDCDVACGMAWVRLMSMYPATGVGVADETAGNCSAGVGADIELGILRCISIGDEAGNTPSAAELLEAADLQHADAMAMWRAVACCTAITSKDYLLGGYAPAGPMGGMVGGTFTLQVAL